jgi:hypothetical protein
MIMTPYRREEVEDLFAELNYEIARLKRPFTIVNRAQVERLYRTIEALYQREGLGNYLRRLK